MGAFVVVTIIIILIITIVLFGFSIYNSTKTEKYAEANIILPFSAYIDPTNPTNTVPITTTSTINGSNSQISCPVGYNVNIIGATFQVFDPYGECYSKPSSVIQKECASSNSSSGSDPVCANLNTSFQNTTCVATNTTNQCIPRDASAYLSSVCNGQQICNVNIDNSSFGPYPCRLQPLTLCSSNGPTNDSGYCALPYLSTSQSGSTNTFSQGYYVHGIYTCVANDE
jgi:hypothetical protein